jgi:hypothetical protein
VDARRRRATILQAKAASHPLRLRILRLCGQQPMTNKQLADRLQSQPPIEAFQAELREAGPGSVRTFARFMLHLSEEEVHELDRRLLAVLDEYIQAEHQRLDRPALGGIVVLHHLADPAPHSPAGPRHTSRPNLPEPRWGSLAIVRRPGGRMASWPRRPVRTGSGSVGAGGGRSRRPGGRGRRRPGR